MIFRADAVTPAVSATYNGAGFHHPAKRQGLHWIPSLMRRQLPQRPRNLPLLIRRPLVSSLLFHCFSCPPDVHGGFFFSRHFRRAAEKYFLHACCRTLARFAFDPYFYGAKRTFCPLKNFSNYPLYTPREKMLYYSRNPERGSATKKR